MRKTNIAIYAAAALGLCLISPEGAAAFPSAADTGKAYTQAATGENLVLVRFARRRAMGVRHYGIGRGFGYGYGRHAYWGGQGWRRAGWRRGYYGGWGPGYGLGLGWGWPLGLGVGFGAATTDWGYPDYYGGYSPAYYRGGGCSW